VDGAVPSQARQSSPRRVLGCVCSPSLPVGPRGGALSLRRILAGPLADGSSPASGKLTAGTAADSGSRGWAPDSASVFSWSESHRLPSAAPGSGSVAGRPRGPDGTGARRNLRCLAACRMAPAGRRGGHGPSRPRRTSAGGAPRRDEPRSSGGQQLRCGQVCGCLTWPQVASLAHWWTPRPTANRSWNWRRGRMGVRLAAISWAGPQIGSGA